MFLAYGLWRIPVSSGPTICSTIGQEDNLAQLSWLSCGWEARLRGADCTVSMKDVPLLTMHSVVLGQVRSTSHSTASMPNINTFVLINSPIQLGQVKLGSLVPNVARPHIDAFEAITLKEEDVLISEQLNFQALLEQGRSSAFEACLSKLVSASADGSKKSSIKLSAHKAMCYEMSTPLSFFKQLSAQESTRLWLQEAIGQGRSSYVVTGFRTLFDANVVQNNISSKDARAAIKVPLGAILAGGVDPTGGLADLGLRGGLGRTARQQQKYLTHGEQIYAVQYRKITFKWFSSKSVDAAFLDAKNRWKILGEDVRAPGKEDEEEEDVVEADITDHATLDYESSRLALNDGQEHYLLIPDGSQP